MPAKPHTTGVNKGSTMDDQARRAIAEKHEREAMVRQRDGIRLLADRIEAGKPIQNDLERIFISGILRAWADQMPVEPKRVRGQAAQYDHMASLWEYMYRVKNGEKPNPVIADLAEKHGCSIEAIKKMLKNNKGFLTVMGIGKKT